MSIFTKIGKALGITKASNNHDLWIELRGRKGGVRDFLRAQLGLPTGKFNLDDVTPQQVADFLVAVLRISEKLSPTEKSLIEGLLRKLLG